MFFTPERLDFFKPLTGKYRESIAQCLCLLYERLYSSNADYGHALSRDQLLEILEEALARVPNIEIEEETDGGDVPQRFKSLREKANWVLKQLLDSGWLEKQVDTATLQSAYPFSRLGRLFTQPLVESDTTRIRTRHRNTRNTLNALEAFATRGEVHDLLDAYEYSERIVTDFTDVISELEERKRELVREVESQQLVQQATDQFFEFMEKRFQPDVAVRLSADSVEKHRDQISKAIGKIRRKPKEYKAEVERQLRRQIPELANPGQSVLWTILDTIEKRMGNAADIMLPALRRALHSFTKRADIIIRQLSYLNSHSNNNLVTLCQQLAELDEKTLTGRLSRAADALASMRVQLVDPAALRLQERRKPHLVNTSVAEQPPLDREAERELLVQQLLDQAFVLDNSSLRHYVEKSLRQGRQISTRHLPVSNARDLLAMAHIIEVASHSNLSRGPVFHVEPTGNTLQTDFFTTTDEFLISLCEQSDNE